MSRRTLAIVILTCLSLAACEGVKNNSSWSTAKEGDPILPTLPPAQLSAVTGEDATSTRAEATGDAAALQGGSGRGVGPVDHVDISTLGAARALEGSKLFPVKCSACHKLDERYIGPALAGVTTRRQPEWILNMILNPENMIQQDPTAKALLGQFLAPMANQHLTRDEAESLLAYFLQHDAGGTPAAETTAPAGTKPAKAVNQ